MDLGTPTVMCSRNVPQVELSPWDPVLSTSERLASPKSKGQYLLPILHTSFSTPTGRWVSILPLMSAPRPLKVCLQMHGGLYVPSPFEYFLLSWLFLEAKGFLLCLGVDSIISKPQYWTTLFVNSSNYVLFIQSLPQLEGMGMVKVITNLPLHMNCAGYNWKRKLLLLD